MSTTTTQNKFILPPGMPPPNMAIPNGEISRLVAAAVVDRRFCQLLLTDVPAALAHGYNKQPFTLNPAELELVLSVKAPHSLADFARQVIEIHNQK
jgi:hypothetical protein